MGVSFKVSKKGNRFRPKPVPLLNPDDVGDDDCNQTSNNADSNTKSLIHIPSSITKLKHSKTDGGAVDGIDLLSSASVSFTLDLYEDGYVIRKPLEDSVQVVPKAVSPYDRRSESLFSAIESGQLPGDFLNEIPVKYVDGALVCEVRDYRKGPAVPGNVVSSMSGSPVITKVSLKMSLENVVKDIPLISDDSWTYGDLMEVESRILKALQPKLCLDPTPMLERLCSDPVPTKLNLGLSGRQKRRLRQMPEVTVASNSQTHGKKVQFDTSGDSGTILSDATQSRSKALVSSKNQLSLKNSGPEALPPALPDVPNQCKYQQGVDNQRVMREHVSGPTEQASGALPSSRDLMMTSNDWNGCFPSLGGKRGHQDALLEPLSNIGKKARQTLASFDVVPQKRVGSQSETITGPDSSLKSTVLREPVESRDLPYVNPGGQKLPDKVLEGVRDRDPGIGGKEVPREIEKLDKPEVGGERGHQDALLEPLSNISKRARQALASFDVVPQKGVGSQSETFTGPDSSLKSTVLRKPVESRDLLNVNPVGQKLPDKVPEGVPDRDPGIGGKEVPRGIEKLDKPEVGRNKCVSDAMGMESSKLDPQQGQINQAVPSHPLTKSHFPSQMQRNNLDQHGDKDSRIDDQLKKNKQMQSHGDSSGVMESFKSFRCGEISTGPLGTQIGAIAGSAPQKPTCHSTSTVGGTPSVAPGNSMQRQRQAPTAPRRRSNALSDNQAVSGVGSPSVSTELCVDPSILNKFSKIELVTKRYQLNCKKKKDVSISVTKPASYSTQRILFCLSDAFNKEEPRDAHCVTQLSKSLVGGSMNICRIRALHFCQNEHKLQDNAVPVISRCNRLRMLDDPSNGTVAVHYSMHNNEILRSEGYLATLPNAYYADLLAAQYCSLMQHEGFQLKDDRIQVQPTPNNSMHNQSNSPGFTTKDVSDEIIPCQPSVASGTPLNNENSSVNSSQNLLDGSRILPPGDNQPLFSNGLTPCVGTHQPSENLQPSVQNHQQQHPQIQRSSMMLPTGPVSHMNSIGHNPNAQLGNQMNRYSKPQNQQQPIHQQQQQPQVQRNMMMGLGTGMGMGNMSNYIAGLGGLGNFIGTGSIMRGAGVTGISGQTYPMGGFGGVDPNYMRMLNTVNQNLYMGNITPAEANSLITRWMSTNRNSIFGDPPSGIAGMSEAGQMHVGFNTNHIQRAAMGPPQMNPGTSLFMNQQQQPHSLMLRQQQQQQQIGSPSQAVVSSPLVGSPPSGMTIQPQLSPQLQQFSPQQISQHTAMSPQLSSGTMPPVNDTAIASTGTGPISPQLIASPVCSITSSPVELQGMSRSNSATNI